MRTIFGVKLNEAILFAVCLVIYAVLVILLWNTGIPGIMPSIADDVKASLPFINGIPGLSLLPDQSLSRLYVSAMLYIISLIYGLASLALSPYRKQIPVFVGYSVITFLGWMALNYWIIAGFINATGVLLYATITVVLLGVWGVATIFFVARYHDAMALFMVRFGLGLGLFIAIVQILSLATPDWRSPTQGIPVLYTLTMNGFVGLFLAGIGGNMLWRERRQEALASGRKKR